MGPLVSQVTQPERLQQLPKVVLSRETCLTAERVPSPWALLGRWQAEARHCFHFGAVGARYGADWLLPERLYRRQGQQLITEALAGTTRRGRDTAQDEALAGALLADKRTAWKTSACTSSC
ncbi:hypothetical protein HAALTHF_15360n [Vreelandella aquamarina]|nr:hypothetical protein HAALTHF_15360n [Halomonas axialensis]